MNHITIVAPRTMWPVIHQRIEPVLSKVGCMAPVARERERREMEAPHLLVEGLTTKAEAILLDVVNGIEPVMMVIKANTSDDMTENRI
jgi:hypothetical protein